MELFISPRGCRTGFCNGESLRAIVYVGIVAAATLLMACKADPLPQDRLARIVAPTAQSRAELARVVAAALNRADVTLADDALTASSVLNIVPKPRHDAQNNQIMGRDVGVPTQFVLHQLGSDCVLELRSSGQRWVLAETTCVAE